MDRFFARATVLLDNCSMGFVNLDFYTDKIIEEKRPRNYEAVSFRLKLS